MAYNWEEEFSLYDYADYKMGYVEQERLRQQHSDHGWIYIGVDVRFNDMAKIGLTTGKPGTRASSSQNPFYTLLCAFKVKEGVSGKVFEQMEDDIKLMLSDQYRGIPHQTTGRRSEWFYVAPPQMRELVHDFLYDNYSSQMYCYHCSQRDVGVIYSWENEKLLAGAPRNPYRADDLSSPPVYEGCFMPGGCGAEDCECW